MCARFANVVVNANIVYCFVFFFLENISILFGKTRLIVVFWFSFAEIKEEKMLDEMPLVFTDPYRHTFTKYSQRLMSIHSSWMIQSPRHNKNANDKV